MLAESPLVWAVGIFIAVVLMVLILVLARFFKLWLQAYFARANVAMLDLIGMSLRKVDPRVIVSGKIRAVQAGVDADIYEMERHYLSGGHVLDVVTALIAAENGNVEMDWAAAAALDLSGQDVIGIVEAAVAARLAGGAAPASGTLRAGAEPDEAADQAEDLSQLVGAEAVAETAVPPPGAVRVGDWEIPALSEEGTIPPGARVRIVSSAGTCVIVRPAES